MKILKDIIWFIKSDVELKTQTCWYGKEEKIDGFCFYSKRPLSKSYQYHASIGLQYTYPVLNLISEGVKKKRKAVMIDISSGWGREKLYIWNGSLKKAEKVMQDMISKIQEQY